MTGNDEGRAGEGSAGAGAASVGSAHTQATGGRISVPADRMLLFPPHLAHATGEFNLFNQATRAAALDPDDPVKTEALVVAWQRLCNALATPMLDEALRAFVRGAIAHRFRVPVEDAPPRSSSEPETETERGQP